MSPEQAGLSGFDVDTRSDVYSLGTLLYELLTGAPPFAEKSLREAGMMEMIRRIREEEPIKPSTRISKLEDKALLSLSKRSQTPPQKLGRLIRGDLDWITLKALEKDRNRRYDSAAALTADILRHLRNEPVEAAAPSVGYRFSKFARRNKASLAAAITIVMLLVMGLISTMWQRNEALEQTRRAEIELKKAQVVSSLVKRMFNSVRPGETRGLDTKLIRIIFERGASNLSALDDQPEVQAELLMIIGQAYHAMGLRAEAEPYLESSFDSFIKILGESHPDTMAARDRLGRLYLKQNRLEQAKNLLERNLELRKSVLGEIHYNTMVSMNHLANFYLITKRYERAEALYVETFERRKAVLGENHSTTLASMGILGGFYQKTGELEKSEPLLRRAIEMQKRELGADHTLILGSTLQFARLLSRQGKYDEAEKLGERILAERRRILGHEHPESLSILSFMAELRYRTKKFKEAELLYLKSLETEIRVLGSEDPHTLRTIKSLGQVYRGLKQFEKAEEFLTRAAEGGR